MTIKAILDGQAREVVTIAGDCSVTEAIALLATRRIGAVPVVSAGTVVGVFSERDVIYCVEAKGAAALDMAVSAVMTAPAITITPADSVLGALSLMTQRRIRHLPVVDAGTLVGLVSIGDLVKHRIERIEADATAMRTYIQQG